MLYEVITITAICKDTNGLFWIGSWGYGVSTFNPVTGESRRIHHFQGDSTSYLNNQISTIVEDRSGYLWIGTSAGLDRYEPRTGTSRHFEHDPNDSLTLSGSAVRSLFIDQEGVLWVGSGNFFKWENSPGGLNRYDPATQTFRRNNFV